MSTVLTHDPTATDRAAARPDAAHHWLLAAAFLMASASVAVFVLLPRLQDELGLPTASLGPIAGASFVAAFVAQIGLAPLADRGWERRLLIGSLVVAGLSLVGTALATSALTLVVMRAAEGLALGTFIPATRALISRGAGDELGHRLGRLSAAEFAGYAIGPLFAAVIASHWSPDAALVSFAVVSLAAVPVVHAVVGHLPAGSAGHTTSAPRLGLDLLRHRHVWAALLLTVAVVAPVGAYDTLWARFLTDNGASTLVIGISLTVFAVPYVLLASRAGRWSDHLGPAAAATRGLLVMSAAIVAYGLLHNVTVIIVLGMVEAAGQALAGPAAQSAAGRAVPEARAGAVQGLAGAAGTLAAGVVAVVAAPAYAAFGQLGVFAGVAALVLATLALSRRQARTAVSRS